MSDTGLEAPAALRDRSNGSLSEWLPAGSGQKAAQQQQPPQQQLRRPVLPQLDVHAAAAVGEAEAAEEAAAEAEAEADGYCSPLSSPSSCAGSPLAAGYYSSSSCLSARNSPCQASPSPSRFRLTPNRLQQHAQANPLWGVSSLDAASPAATPAVAVPTPADGSVSSGIPAPVFTQQQAPPPQQAQQQRLIFDDEDDEGDEDDEVAAGSGGGLLESLLTPQHLKPHHSRLLGQMMHTSTGRTQPQPHPQQQAQAAAPAVPAGEEHEEQQQQPEAVAAAADAAAAAVATPPGSLRAAAATNSSSNGAGARGPGLKLLGMVVVAAATVAAGLAAKQGRSGGRARSVAHPQPVPSLPSGRQKASSSEQQPRPAGRSSTGGNGGKGSAGVCWDSPYTVTRG
jgi:hypothetical protein